MQLETVDPKKLRFVAEKMIGLAKEAVGVLINNDSLQGEGEAQQDRASEKLRALRKEAEAVLKDAKAEFQERRQQAAQRAKG